VGGGSDFCFPAEELCPAVLLSGQLPVPVDWPTPLLSLTAADPPSFPTLELYPRGSLLVFPHAEPRAEEAGEDVVGTAIGSCEWDSVLEAVLMVDLLELPPLPRRVPQNLGLSVSMNGRSQQVQPQLRGISQIPSVSHNRADIYVCP
jgi:hypothetical protein